MPVEYVLAAMCRLTMLASPPRSSSFVSAAGASTTDDILKIRLQLTKPVTWIPLIWGVLCGAAASGTDLVPRPWLWGASRAA